MGKYDFLTMEQKVAIVEATTSVVHDIEETMGDHRKDLEEIIEDMKSHDNGQDLIRYAMLGFTMASLAVQLKNEIIEDIKKSKDEDGNIYEIKE